MIHHPPESTDWLNVLLAQFLMQYREDAKINDRLILAVDEVLNGGVRPSFVVRFGNDSSRNTVTKIQV